MHLFYYMHCVVGACYYPRFTDQQVRQKRKVSNLPRPNTQQVAAPEFKPRELKSKAHICTQEASTPSRWKGTLEVIFLGDSLQRLLATPSSQPCHGPWDSHRREG